MALGHPTPFSDIQQVLEMLDLSPPVQTPEFLGESDSEWSSASWSEEGMLQGWGPSSYTSIGYEIFHNAYLWDLLGDQVPSSSWSSPM